jgi:general L-amino acid transport system substrate-binding protein
MRRASLLFGMAVAVCLGFGGTDAAHAGETLDAVRARGFVNCGVSDGVIGFSLTDAKGSWAGLEVDICRAVAAAVFGRGDKVKFLPFNALQRFTALQSGEIDILARVTTFTLKRDTSLGLSFAPPTFYTGQGVMVPAKLGVKSLKDLGGATFCIATGTTTELNLADYFRSHKMEYKPVVIQSVPERDDAFFAGRCDALTDDGSGLAATRTSHHATDADYVILPDIISKEPLAEAYRKGDPQWGDIITWTVYALFQAEESGVTQANVEAMKKSPNPEIQRMLGVDPGLGAALGVSEDWVVNIVKAVGNYGEIYERNVGMGSALKLPRGLNAQWTNGGLIYAIPLR